MNTAIGNDTEAVLRQWRTSILNSFFTIAAVISLPALAAIIVNVSSRPALWPFAVSFSIVEVFLIGLAVFRGIPFGVRVAGLWLIGYAASILNLMNAGLNGAGPLYLLAMPVLILILAGKRPGILTGALSSLLAAGSAFLTARGLLTPTLIPRSPWGAFATFLMFQTIVMTLLILFYRFQEGLINEERLIHSKLRHAHALLEEQNANLEKKVEERTAELQTSNLRLKQRNAELATINSVQVSLASKLDIDSIYELISEKVREVFNVQVMDIVDYDPASNLISMPYSYEKGDCSVISPREPYGFREQVIRNRAPLLVNQNFVALAEKYNNPLLTGEWPKSALFVPLLVNGEVKSIISIQDLDHENAYNDVDVQLLQTLSTAMSVALENSRLWEKEKMYRKALERELEIGREIQAGFLPDDLPLVEGWEIAASLMSAREVAGDFYDAFELPDGNIGLVIADICDKGVGAALFMTLFRSLIRATSNQEYFEHAGVSDMEASIDERLRHAITLTNNYIAETHEKSGMFATIFFGILDPRTGKLSYINGGHEPPLIIQAGTVREVLQKTGPAVGAITNCNFQIRETQLQEGDLFFAFTDGVPDSKDPHGEFFGRERLLDIFQHFSGSAHILVDTLESELHHYINGAARFDDVTLMAIRRGEISRQA